MLIVIDLANPTNDLEVIGLHEGETLEGKLGGRSYLAYRLLESSARLLFLTRQQSTKPDVKAATETQLSREAQFARQRLNELAPKR
ncbi:MAG: hypothetical protein NVS2B7_27800 [Herpetosiphon sp.]